MLDEWRTIVRLALVLVTAGFLIACAGNEPAARDSLAEACTAIGGTWLSEHQECETGEQAWCEARDGTFDPCASACRHSDSEVCIAMCMPLCSFSP